MLRLPLLASVLFALPTASLTTAAETPPRDPAKLATEFCAGCHGPTLTGGTAPNLLDSIWKHGEDDDSILRSIRAGFPQAGMAGYDGILSDAEMRELLSYLRRRGRQFTFGLVPVTTTAPTAVTVRSEQQTFRLETVAEPLDTPWGIVFLPGGTMLVSDRAGTIRVVAQGKLLPEPIRDTPQPYVQQDGGMLDLIAHPDYARNGWLYLAYTESGTAKDSTGTIVVRGRIRDGAWVDQTELFRAPQEFYTVKNYTHYGCRFLFDRDGHLFFTIGDRGRPLDAQDLRSPLGKIHRVHDDGRIPSDNPFVKHPGAWPSIWSYGHRHVQGLQFHPVTGKLWATEHGPRGGDELNRIERGANYGWPVISNGLAQAKEKIEGTSRVGMKSPLAWWTPSIAPAAIEFYTGDRFPQWKNQLFITSLVGRHLRRVELDGDKVGHQEVLFQEMGRVRDVVTGPDGYLYLAMNNPGRIARIVPFEAEGSSAPPSSAAAR